MDQKIFLDTLLSYGARIEIDELAKPENDLHPNPALLQFMLRLVQDQVAALERRVVTLEGRRSWWTLQPVKKLIGSLRPFNRS